MSERAAARAGAGASDDVRLLIVDDSTAFCGAVATALDKIRGVDVVAIANDGRTALKVLAQLALADTPIDVVLLDVEMPIKDGLSVLPDMLSVSPPPKVIMASALSKLGAAASLRALSLGASDYVGKPCSHEDASVDGFHAALVEKIRDWGAAAKAQRLERQNVAPGPFRQRRDRTAEPFQNAKLRPKRNRSLAGRQVLKLDRKASAPVETASIASPTGRACEPSDVESKTSASAQGPPGEGERAERPPNPTQGASANDAPRRPAQLPPQPESDAPLARSEDRRACSPEPKAPKPPPRREARRFVDRAPRRRDATPSARAPAPRATAPEPPAKQSATTRRSPRARRFEALAIGGSTGGPQALMTILRDLRGGIRTPIFVTQHMPRTFTAILAEQLGKAAGIEAAEGVDGERVEAGRLYLAPGDRHMLARRVEGGVAIVLDDGPLENFCKPAVDPMLRSLCEIYGPALLVVILTGMGQDGMRGCQLVSEKGGRVIAQDKESSVVWGMPGAVAKMGLADEIHPLDAIAGVIRSSM